ncbi:acetyltransferase [compost metagenome]
METTYKTEPLTNTDSEKIINLILPIQQIENNVPVTLEDQPDLLNIESVYHKSGGGFWGIKHNDEIIGTIALIAFEGNGGAIRKMFVKKEFRGKEFGLAQQLLETLIDYCKKQGITDLYLGTLDTLKAAIRFYERNGFELIAKETLPVSFPVMQVDNRFFHLKIS